MAKAVWSQKPLPLKSWFSSGSRGTVCSTGAVWYTGVSYWLLVVYALCVSQLHRSPWGANTCSGSLITGCVTRLDSLVLSRMLLSYLCPASNFTMGSSTGLYVMLLALSLPPLSTLYKSHTTVPKRWKLAFKSATSYPQTCLIMSSLYQTLTDTHPLTVKDLRRTWWITLIAFDSLCRHIYTNPSPCFKTLLRTYFIVLCVSC